MSIHNYPPESGTESIDFPLYLGHMRVDFIIPVFNEEEGITTFHLQLRQAIDPLPHQFHIYYIDDGSSDHTCERLSELARQDERVTVVEFSRNFGQQAALTAGIDLSQGDYAITMDGDGEHPPALIPEMLRLAQNGYDIVLTQRVDQEHTRSFKARTSDLFYRLINWIGDTRIQPRGTDFRAMSRPVVEALRSMHEYHRFMRGMVAWVGYRTVILPYQQPERIAGTSKYTLRRMFQLALTAVFSFSLVPLYIAISVGGLFLVGAVLEAIYVLSFWVSGNIAHLAPGWSSLMFMLLVVGGSLMICLGFIGIYVGYIFQEVKKRPIYLIRRKWSGDSYTDTNDIKSQETPLE
ncbi:MAG TPA: glycosyltransferase family 2 protein [Anaerolineaceae bacterium]